MANNLTGDYDALVQVKVGAINGILATLHQNGVTPENSPIFLHSFSLHIGTPSKLSIKATKQLADWVHLVMQNQNKAAKPVTAESLVRKAPPGISAGLSKALEGLKKIEVQPIEPDGVSGFAQAQLSPPLVSFIPGSTAQVNGSVRIRANYIPENGTPALPEPVHGVINIVFSLQVSPKPGFNTQVLEVNFPQNDSNIQFFPAAGSGLSTTEANKLEAQIRSAIRKAFEPTNMELPEGFQFNHFKALGSSSNQVVALPVHLSNGPAPSVAALGGVNTNFLSTSDGFGIAVSKEFILSLVQPQLDGIKATHPQFLVSGLAGTATYTTNFTQAQAAWVNSKIRINISGNSTTPTWWAPNVSSFSIQQNLVFQFDENSQTLDVVPQGQPGVSVNVNGPIGGLVEDMIKPTITSSFITERNKALDAARNEIQQIFSGAGSINDALKTFDSGTHAKYKTLDATGDGLVLHGIIYTKYRPGPVVKVTETGDGTGFSALKSWIPGGVIDRFEWTWVDKGQSYIPWAATVKSAADEHRFILPKPAGIEKSSQVCLYLRGKYIYPGSSFPQAINIGTELSVEGGDTCSVNGPEFVFVMPAWWDKIMTPIWDVDPPPEEILTQAIIGHVESVAQDPADVGANTIVHFANLEEGAPFDGFNQVFENFDLGDMPMALALVLPNGSFNQSRRDLERRLGALNRFSGAVHITEDYQSGWSRTFGVEKSPATFLSDTRGEFAWQQHGPLDARALAEALRKNAVEGPPPSARSISLTVKVGDLAPDVLMQSLEGDQLALGKLRGRAVVLCFWQSWSVPCVRELRRLTTDVGKKEKDGEQPIVLAVNGGENRETIACFADEHELEVTVILDPEKLIKDRYGVRCWPTTVSIDGDGRINNIRFGIVHSHGRPVGER